MLTIPSASSGRGSMRNAALPVTLIVFGSSRARLVLRLVSRLRCDYLDRIHCRRRAGAGDGRRHQELGRARAHTDRARGRVVGARPASRALQPSRSGAADPHRRADARGAQSADSRAEASARNRLSKRPESLGARREASAGGALRRLFQFVADSGPIPGQNFPPPSMAAEEPPRIVIVYFSGAGARERRRSRLPPTPSRPT